MNHTCKLCKQPIEQLYTIANIPFYYCSSCDFLQNFYWEEHSSAVTQEQEAINTDAIKTHWIDGEDAHARAKGWHMLELMFWPLAWKSRILHTTAGHIPGYTAFVHQFIQRHHRKILDFGCGLGTIALQLHTKDGIDIHGLDPFSPTIHPNIIRKHLLDVSLPGESFDGIYGIEAFEHIPNVLEIFQECYRILKPGGMLLVQTRRLEDPEYKSKQDKWFYLKDPKTHVSIYSEQAMQIIAHHIGFKKVSFRGTKFARFMK